MNTLDNISILIVTALNDANRLKSVYHHTRAQYPSTEIVIVYDNCCSVLEEDAHLIQVETTDRVYVSKGYNLAIKNSTKDFFVFLHDDTYTAPNFLENLLPHLSDTTFCNFVAVEPPIFGNPNTIQKPINNFGLSAETFDKESFDLFYWNHTSNLPHTSEPSPFGGFFMAGSVHTFRSIGGFDEQFVPYFFEDSDLMVRLHLAGYRFSLILNSIVYHIGSLTSRTSEDSQTAHNTTRDIFLRKWKTSFDLFKQHVMLNNTEYQDPSIKIQAHNIDNQLNSFLQLLHNESGINTIEIDGTNLSQSDVDYLLQIPYLIQNTEPNQQYQLGNLLLKTHI